MEEDILKEDEVLEKLGLMDKYIIQKKTGYRFSVDPVLLAGFAQVKDKDKILDFGTGGGILPFLLQKNNKELDLEIIGIDIQEEYIEMAERSCKLNNIKNIRFLALDIRDIKNDFAAKFDLVVSNPPFFKPYEGRISNNKEIAVSRHELEIDFQTIIKKAAYCLHNKGRFVFIHRSQRLLEIGEMIRQEKMSFSKIRFIYPDLNSGSRLFLAEAVKRPGAELKVESPLIIYDQRGKYTEEVRMLYE